MDTFRTATSIVRAPSLLKNESSVAKTTRKESKIEEQKRHKPMSMAVCVCVRVGGEGDAEARKM